ncbi:MAG: biotin--[Clostridia bacterium]|nr:biotin--[acetyl-CoA-carboxylase] ligase [Clostridia bacterium]
MNCESIRSNICIKDIKVICFNSIDSTSSYLRRLLNDGEKGTVLAVSKEQTAGRGRSGKSFYSPDCGGLYMSLLIHPEIGFDAVPSVTAKVCVAVCRAIEKVTGVATDIKWVNDLYLNGKKVCGILCEAVNDYKNAVTKSIIIGVGVNVSTAEFPEDLQGIAGSLGVSQTCCDKLVSEIANALLNLNFGALSDGELAFYRERSCVLGKTINYYVDGQKNTAEAVAIDSSGGLVVKNINGEALTLTSGEISVRLY